MTEKKLYQGCKFELWRVQLHPGEEATFPGLAWIHPLVGRATIGDRLPIGARMRVFDSFTGGIFSLGGTISACSDSHFDALICRPHTTADVSALDRMRVEAIEHTIGDGTSRRVVREILGEHSPIGVHCGETVNEIGGWSSWPQHDFERNEENRANFEEVFVYFTQPRNGWGIQCRNGDLPAVIRSGDCIQIYMGNHPVVAGPSTRLMYVWFYSSPVSKSYPKWAEDIGEYRQ